MTPNTLLLSGIMDVRERYLRALAGLTEAEAAAYPGTRTILHGYRIKLLAGLESFQNTIAPLVEGAMVAYGENPDDWDESDLVDLAQVTIRRFDELLKIHLDLCVHLAASGRTREDLSYLLTRALDLSLMSREHSKLLSVHQSQQLTWEATRFTEHPSAVAIAVPWLETLTPQRWPLAVHEFGHYFLPMGGLAKPRITEVAAHHGWRMGDISAFQEVVADAVAQRAFGDAYGFALAREGYLFSYQRHVAGGASVAKRLELLGLPDDLAASLPTAWNLGFRTGPAEEGVEPERETSADAATEMREQAVALVGAGTPNRPDRVAAARALMRANEPAAAVTIVDEGHAAAVAALAEKLANPTSGPLEPDAVKALTSLAVQECLTDGEILEAAWREDCERDPAAMVGALTVETFSEDEISQQSQDVATRDTWLAQSLQSAAVHRWLDKSRDLAKDSA